METVNWNLQNMERPDFVGKDFQGRQSDICRLLLFYQDKRECDLCS